MKDLGKDVLQLDIFNVECRCGQGWCNVHGTYTLPSDLDPKYPHVDYVRGTGGGKRIKRKKIGGDNY